MLSGPSGVGKGTVVKRILENNKNIKLSISATTRKMREGEVNGKSYYFYEKEKFLEVAENGGMLEYARYCDNFYGTPKAPIEQWLEDGFDVLLEIEVKGAKQIKEKCKDCLFIFLLPPSLEVLYNRLKERGTESESSLKVRLQRAKEELEEAFLYDYLVVNDSLAECAGSVLSVVKAEKLKFSRMKNYLSENFFGEGFSNGVGCISQVK